MERRILHTKLKTDDWVASLDDQQYRIFITLLLMTNSVGIFKATIFEISAFSRQDYQTVVTVLKQFETVSKVFFIDEYIILANHSKYYVFDNPNQVRGACKEIQSVPETVLSDIRVLQVITKLAEKLLPKANESDTKWLTERIETVPEQFRTVPETYNILHNTYNIIHNIKEVKEKETVDKQPTEKIQSIFDYWNTQDIITHRVLTDDIRKTIQTAFSKKYTAEMIKQAIDHYSEQCHLPNSWHNNNKSSWLTLQKFIKQSNGFGTWLDKLPCLDAKPIKAESNMYTEPVKKGLF